MRKIAEFTVDHPWMVILTVLAVTVLFGTRLPLLTVEDTVETFFLEDDPSIDFFHHFLEIFDTDEFFLLAFKTNDAYSDESLDLVRRLTERFEEVENVEQVISLTNAADIFAEDDVLEIRPLVGEENLPPEQRNAVHRRALANPMIAGNVVSEDGRTTAIFGRTRRIANDFEYRKVLTADLREIIADEVPPGLPVYLAGGPVFYTIYMEYVKSDLRLFMPLSMAILAVLMILIYRRWRAVWLPMVCVISSLVWTLGLIQVTGRSMSLVTNIIPPLLTVIGLAVIVHILNRYDEAYGRIGNSREAVIESLVHLFRPCFLTSLTTSIGFGSLALSRIMPIREAGLFAAFGVMSTFLVSITMAPAILSLLKPPTPKADRMPSSGAPGDRIGALLVRCDRLVKTHPVWILAVSGAFTMAGIGGMLLLRIETNLIEYFRETSEVRVAYDFLQANISGANSFEILIEGGGPDSVLEPAVLRALEATQRELERSPRITQTQSLADLVKMMNRAFHDGDEARFRIPDTRPEVAQLLLLLSMSDDRGGLDLFANEEYSCARISSRMTTVPSPELRRLIAGINSFTAGVFPEGIRAEPTGEVPLYVDMERNLVEGQIKSFGVALVIIIACVMVFFGSVRVGLYSIFPNIVPILMTLGLMGLVGIPINMATSMLPSIAIGIAVDDTIHIISRIRNEYRHTGNREIARAIYASITTTGRAMLITSIVLFFGFMVLVTSRFQPNAYFGLLTALTMVWALAADLLTLPALLVLLKPKRF